MAQPAFLLPAGREAWRPPAAAAAGATASRQASLPAAAGPALRWWRTAAPLGTASALGLGAAFAVATSRRRRAGALPRPRAARRVGGGVDVAPAPPINVPEELKDIEQAGRDTGTPHWSEQPMKEGRGLRMEQLDWPNLHGIACGASGVLFLLELVRFVAGQPPSDAECYVGAAIYAAIYASRFEGIRNLAPHFRVTFYATTGWTVYYIAHLLAATNPEVFSHAVYPAGVIFLASTIYFYKHWLERMWRHFLEDRFRPYYMPGLLGLMYFHSLDVIDLFNQWLDPLYWWHVPVMLPDQAWTIQDVRLTGLFMSSMALFMITLHNKGVLTGGRNTLITVLFTIFVPALFLTGTHATLQASFP